MTRKRKRRSAIVEIGTGPAKVRIYTINRKDGYDQFTLAWKEGGRRKTRCVSCIDEAKMIAQQVTVRLINGGTDTDEATRRLIRLARVSSTGVHIEKLIFDPDVFLRESIRVPADLAEQQQIAAILDTADQELTLLRTQRNALDQQKRGLMQRLLTGRIRVAIH